MRDNVHKERRQQIRFGKNPFTVILCAKTLHHFYFRLLILNITGCGHATELNRDSASKSRLMSNHDLANNRDLIHFWSDYRVKSRFASVEKPVNHAKNTDRRRRFYHRSVHARRHVAAARRGDKPLLVYRSCDKLLQQLTKILQYTRSDLSPRRVAATCCSDLSPSVYRPYDFPANFCSSQFYIVVLSFKPLPPFNLFIGIKGIRLVIHACFTLLKKLKLFIFMIFFSLVQFLRSCYQSKFIFLPRFSLSLGSFTTNPQGPEPHMMLDVVSSLLNNNIIDFFVPLCEVFARNLKLPTIVYYRSGLFRLNQHCYVVVLVNYIVFLPGIIHPAICLLFCIWHRMMRKIAQS